jgi:hypothetical protein
MPGQQGDSLNKFFYSSDNHSHDKSSSKMNAFDRWQKDWLSHKFTPTGADQKTCEKKALSRKICVDLWPRFFLR